MRLLQIFVGPVVKRIYRFKFVQKEACPKTPGIIISNHNNFLDPALIMIAFSGHCYFVASEHIFRKGFASKLLTFVFDPIPISKVQSDAFTMKEIFRRLKAGFNVCVFAEGNRSYNGITGPIPIATAKMIKISGAQLVTYHFEGGYFSTPRWGKSKRQGRVSGRLAGRYSSEQLAGMTAEQILETIERDIWEDAYTTQKKNPVRYRGKNLAEHIEIILYLCPCCNKIGTIHSNGNNFSCSCGLNVSYTETGYLEGDLPFSTITEWYSWQAGQLAAIIDNAGDEPICADNNVRLHKVETAKSSEFIAAGSMSISRTEFCCAGFVYPLQDIKQFAIIGKSILVFSLKNGTQYEVLRDIPYNALKYCEIFRILKT